MAASSRLPPMTNPLRYIGALGYSTERALGLHYVRALWLRPATGSSHSVDPVPGEPRYPYAHSSPLVQVDAGGRRVAPREDADAISSA